MRNIARLMLIAVLVVLSIPALAIKKTGGEYNTLYGGVGIRGYDVVSYFTDGKPVEGSTEYTFDYGGVAWRFASAQHRDLFAANPGKYAPQYGGFCAVGVSKGFLFEVDPVNGWTLYNGKLYMNFNGDVNRIFASQPATIVHDAEQRWPTLNN